MKNYPMVCQSLQAVAAFLKFDWNDGTPVPRPLPRPALRLLGQARRCRAATTPGIGELVHQPRPLQQPDPAGVRLRRLGRTARPAPAQRRRLRGLPGGHAGPAARLPGPAAGGDGAHRQRLPRQPADREDRLRPARPGQSSSRRPATLAHALHEFVTIERHVELAAWKSGAPRAAGAAGADRADARSSATWRRTRSRTCRRAEPGERARDTTPPGRYRAAYRAAQPDAKPMQLPKEQKAECDWSPGGAAVPAAARDRPTSPATSTRSLRLTTLKPGDRLVLSPAGPSTGACRSQSQTPFTPTAKQMLYGMRADADALDIAAGRMAAAGRGLGRGGSLAATRFGGHRAASRSARSTSAHWWPARRYTLDPDPNDCYGLWAAQVVEGLIAGGQNTLYDLLADRIAGAHCLARGSGGGAGALPGRARRAPRRPARCTTSSRASGSTSAATATPRSSWSRGRPAPARATPPPSPSSPGSRARWRPTATSASSSPARPTRRPTCCSRTCATVREMLREVRRRPPGALRHATSTRGCSTSRSSASGRAATYPAGVIPLPEDDEREPGTPQGRRVHRGVALVRGRGDARRHLRPGQGPVAQGALRAPPRRLPGARRGLADEPAGGGHGGAAADAGRPADRGRRPPPDAADRQARLGERAAPHVPGVPLLRVAVRHPAAARAADDPVRGELPAARRHGRVPAPGGLRPGRHRLPLPKRHDAARRSPDSATHSWRAVLDAGVPADRGRPRRGREPGAQPRSSSS